MISLEKVQQSELAQIHFLQKIAFESLYDTYQDEGSPFKQTQASLLAKFKRPLECYFFIKQQDKRIGYLRVVMDDSGTTAKIGPIGVDPLVEGQGIGTQAMQLVEQTFPEVKEWRLSTILQETTLCHFYEKMGYQKTGEIVWIQEEMALVFYIKTIEDKD